jgi:type IV pilus assembly protein PilB
MELLKETTNNIPCGIPGLLYKKGFISSKQIDYALRISSKLKNTKTLLNILKELNYVTKDQIGQAIQSNISVLKIGDILVELEIISESELKAGLEIQAKGPKGKKLGEILIENNFISEQELTEMLSLQLGFPIIDPEYIKIDKKLFSKGSLETYDFYEFIPIHYEADKAVVVFANPLSQDSISEAQRIFGNNITLAICTKSSIKARILRSGLDSSKITYDNTGISAVEIVDSIISGAIKESNVSDIHVEPMKDKLRIRFRKDGVLTNFKDFPKDYIPEITSRFKIISNADIAEKRRHQGGRVQYEYEDRFVDLRVSFYVTIYGEKIVMRILNRKNENLNLEEIGMSPRLLEKFRFDALDCPSGVLIVTGPTGSGKTTTVYSGINYLNHPDTCIITAEDPVEYIIEGVSQCSINEKIGLSYNETLRHIVRQDPDIIMIGEIRDKYSADIAIQAAMTGHKVITTFHTEDSVGGMLRLLNMDIDAFLISSTVVCIVAQRLLRKICTHCSEPYLPSPKEILLMGCNHKTIQGIEFRKGKGCLHCKYTGYAGRIAIFELLALNEHVRDALIEKKTSFQIRKISIETTEMVTLFEDGFVKATLGLTTVHELLRCLPRLYPTRPLSQLRRLLGV